MNEEEKKEIIESMKKDGFEVNQIIYTQIIWISDLDYADHSNLALWAQEGWTILLNQGNNLYKKIEG